MTFLGVLVECAAMKRLSSNAALSRRSFLAGAASLGAFGGLRAFAASGYGVGRVPNLSFGVLSDVHIKAFAGADDCARGCACFRGALEWFRAQGVDAVMIAGDLADNGVSDQLQAFADTWFAVFPDDRAPDGRKVEKLFVYGNHDWEGCYSNDYKRKNFMRPDYARCWERIVREPYEPIFMKTVRGYSFIGQHWDRQGWHARCKFERIVPFMAAHGKSLDPKMPFFYFQHPHPKDTCYGSWAGGHDVGIVTKELSAYPNAIAFSGHSHLTLTDERTIWQGSFTSVGTGSLSYTGGYAEFDGGYENDGHGGWAANAAKLMPPLARDCCRQGMIWRVYDDCIVAQRREFVGADALELGPDWVVPLPAAESRPFAFAAHAKKVSAPAFAADAEITLSAIRAKNRGGKNPKDPADELRAEEKDAYSLTIPPAVGKDGARALYYEVSASAGGKTRTKRVLAHGYNHAVELKSAHGNTRCIFARSELPEGEVEFRAVPVNSLGRRGNPLRTIYEMPSAQI